MRSIKFISVLPFLLVQTELLALPIGFGHNQGSLNYEELIDNEFSIYHDARTPNEAQYTLRALKSAKPVLANWLSVQRDSSLPVIMTAEAAGASFANFITDAIELQTLGMGTRDLAWHELTHTMMYEHLHNILGPAGSIIHLAWMPSWFLEGLAESTSVSINSAIQSSFERYLALTGRWPSYESLHSLYSGYTDSYLGYAISGSFVSYLIRHQALAEKMPNLLEDFYYNSMPWMWPWAMIPYNPFLPMDDALEDYTKLRGRELYEKYKTEAMNHWKKNIKGEFLYQRPGPKMDVSYLGRLQSDGTNIITTLLQDNSYHLAKMIFDPTSGWLSDYKNLRKFPSEVETRFFSKRKKRLLFSRNLVNAERRYGFELFRKTKNGVKVLIKGEGRLVEFFETKKSIAYISHDGETFKLCNVQRRQLIRDDKLPIEHPLCPLEISQPRIMQLLGRGIYDNSELTEKIIIGITEQKITGDEYSVLLWNPDNMNQELQFHKMKEKPVAATSNSAHHWLAFEGTSYFALRKYDSSFKTCLLQKDLADIPTELLQMHNGDLVLRLLHGTDDHILKISEKNLNAQSACQPIGVHTSPLLWTTNQNRIPTMKAAFAATDIWSKPVQLPSSAPPASTPSRSEERGSDQEIKASVPASVRFRPVFAVPWVGGDSGGYNYGILSVPLMDDMQNWTVQLTALYGSESRFPTTQLSAHYTGFWPKISLEAYRYQTWNGVFLETENSPLKSAYLDERGTKVSWIFQHMAWRSQFSLGLKTALLKKYIGPSGRVGRLNEMFVSTSKISSLGMWTFSNSLELTSAPEQINGNFDYNAAEVSSNILRRFGLWEKVHRLTFGLQYNITRGKKVRRLRESYRPLRIFIPDGGGGLNNISVPVISGGGLFSASFGDTSARSKLDYSFPLVQNIDSLVRLFYIHELKFSAFLNYGGAWYQEPFPSDPDQLIAAHGYALDLLFDLKGINFNLGGGTGQVFGQPFEVFLTFGFDQIF